MKRDYWIKSRQKPIRNNINSKKQVLGQIWKFMKAAWHKHNLMTFSSIGSVHPNNYTYEILHEYLSGWWKILGKIVLIKYSH